jgi:hypothetical protein
MKHIFQKIGLMSLLLISCSYKSDALPYAKPAEGKQGYVYSPYSYEGYVDVRGFPAGTEVKCPYTGKIFLVPETVSEVPDVQSIRESIANLRAQINSIESEESSDESSSIESSESCNDDEVSTLDEAPIKAYSNVNVDLSIENDQSVFQKIYNQAFAQARANGDSLIDSRSYANEMARTAVKEIQHQRLMNTYKKWEEAGRETLSKPLQIERTLGTGFGNFNNLSTQ